MTQTLYAHTTTNERRDYPTIVLAIATAAAALGQTVDNRRLIYPQDLNQQDFADLGLASTSPIPATRRFTVSAAGPSSMPTTICGSSKAGF